MAWNDQNTPVSGPVPAYGPAPPAPITAPSVNGGLNYAAPQPQQGYVGSYSQNPLATGQPPVAASRPPSPLQPTALPPNSVPPRQMPVAAGDSDRIDAGDEIWIERTKRAIAETQNDPHRQVQLLQHLNKLYLKERFGREVQADQG